MIVESFDIATPIIMKEALGKRIGFMQTHGNCHEGHQAVIKRLREECDYIVVQLPKYVHSEKDNDYIWMQYFWKDHPSYNKYLTHFEIGDENAEKYDKFVDIVIRESPPIIDDYVILEDVKSFVLDTYVPAFSKISDIVFDSNNIAHTTVALDFSNSYYINKYLFPIHVQVCSYKDGVHRLIRKILWEDKLGIKYPLISPIRDQYGICISATRDKELNKNENSLRHILQGKPLITSINETLNSLSLKVCSGGWQVNMFKKYTDTVLLERVNGKAFIDVVIINPTGRKVGMYNNNPSEGYYAEGFLF